MCFWFQWIWNQVCWIPITLLVEVNLARWLIPWHSSNKAPHGGDICSMQRDVESVHSGHYGPHMGFQCNIACAYIEIQIICNLFWALEAICHWIIVAAQYCCLIKKSGYPVGYWIFRTAKKGYLFRGLKGVSEWKYLANNVSCSSSITDPIYHISIMFCVKNDGKFPKDLLYYLW